jgi:hypothetical protein
MKTSSFRLYSGPGRISTARWAPRGCPAGYRAFKALAPGPWFRSVDPQTYCRLYAEILAKLDPMRTWDELHRLAGDAEPVLLCWEVLAPDELGTPEGGPFNPRNWCHRRLIASHFERALGVEVPELTRANATEQQLPHLFAPLI